MMYLDANFFIFAIFDKTEKGENARRIQSDIVEGRKTAVTSVLAIDEVMWVLIKNKRNHLLRTIIEDIYALNNVRVLEVPPLIPLQAIEIMEKFRLKPRDAFHVAIMENLQIDTIVSDDSDFDSIKKIKRISL